MTPCDERPDVRRMSDASVTGPAGAAAMQGIGLVEIFAVWSLVDKVGRKWIQSVGFLGLAPVFIIMGLLHHPGLFLGLFLILSLVDQGPGQLTYVYAGEVFPTSLRATGQGFATASSRIGALVMAPFP